jgi:biotin carboxylase
MGARLHLCGVPAAEQILAADESTLVNWATHHGKWPVVIKPTLSAGSDSVAICQTAQDVRQAFQSTIGKANKLGGINDAVLGQEFLKGQQYLVNTVSVDGRHYVGEIWSFDSTFEGAHQVYDRQLLLPPNGQLQDQIVSYVYQVLDALEIRRGAAHTEVMLTRDGPRLIESAARMTGKIGQKALLAAIGHHHIRYVPTAIWSPTRCSHACRAMKCTKPWEL